MTNKEYRAFQGQLASSIRELKTRVKITKETGIIRAPETKNQPESVRKQIKL